MLLFGFRLRHILLMFLAGFALGVTVSAQSRCGDDPVPLSKPLATYGEHK